MNEITLFAKEMKIPAITGTIRRRILLNYRVAPDVARAVLPTRFRPKLVGDHAIAGICLIRLEGARSAYYDDRSIFPAGSIELDHALLMRDIPHEWHSEPTMVSDEPKANKASLSTPAPPRVQSVMTVQPSTRCRSLALGQV